MNIPSGATGQFMLTTVTQIHKLPEGDPLPDVLPRLLSGPY